MEIKIDDTFLLELVRSLFVKQDMKVMACQVEQITSQRTSD